MLPRSFASLWMTTKEEKGRVKTKKENQLMLILFARAENEARTRDPNLGKVMLYQLSYFRRL